MGYPGTISSHVFSLITLSDEVIILMFEPVLPFGDPAFLLSRRRFGATAKVKDEKIIENTSLQGEWSPGKVTGVKDLCGRSTSIWTESSAHIRGRGVVRAKISVSASITKGFSPLQKSPLTSPQHQIRVPMGTFPLSLLGRRRHAVVAPPWFWS